LIRKAFEILIPYRDGLPPKTVLERIAESLSTSESEARTHGSRPLRSFEEVVWLATIAPAKAGWLRNDRVRWLVTEAGERAYAEFQDPEEFIAQAIRLSRQGWVSVQFPNLYRFATRTADQLIMDYKLIRRVGPRQLLGKALGGGTRPWQEVLPVQSPQRYRLPELDFGNEEDIQRHLDSLGAPYMEGGHTIYVPPDTARRSGFRPLMSGYPADAGLKIIKRGGGVNNSSYIHEALVNRRGNSRLQQTFTHDHKHLSLVANLLFVKGLGPRLYDLIEFETGARLWTAYVIEHVGGSVPSVAQCEAGIEELKELERRGLFRNNIPDGWDDEDFTCPRCNGNALVDETGKFNYIDFQNFNLVGYEAYLRETALEATEKSHFGQNYILRRGRYLYQSVPGVRLPGRRNVEDRMVVIRRLLEEARVSVEGRMVLDVGCNIGMMMAQYLKLGAKWCHGWDREYLVPHTERLLSALGCTRFSTTGGDIDRDRPLDEEVPEFLRDALRGCVISYLAVRGHLGWLDALGRIPWSFLIYEGHEQETPEDFENDMAIFKEMVGFRVAGMSTYKDGDSDERMVAVLIREDESSASRTSGASR
jgi:hypothetical protein